MWVREVEGSVGRCVLSCYRDGKSGGCCLVIAVMLLEEGLIGTNGLAPKWGKVSWALEMEVWLVVVKQPED